MAAQLPNLQNHFGLDEFPQVETSVFNYGISSYAGAGL